jgi:hypothetical protein
MSKRSDLVKSIVKKPIGEKPTFGTDPRDPWSAKYNISEDAVLNTFLKSRGLNPLHVSKDQKVAHSKMGEFLKWKKDHMFTRPVSEATDKKDTVTFDIPLLIRVLELTREDIKSDADLHRVVERLIQIRNKGVLTMADYRMIASLPSIRPRHFKENHIDIAMGKMMDDEGSMVLDQLEQLERAIDMIRTYVGKDQTKQLPAWVQSKVTLATDYVDTVGNYLSSKNEEASHDPWKDKHFGPTKIIKQKYHVKTDTKSYNVKADNEDHAHKLVTKHAPGSKIVSIEHKGRMMEEIEIDGVVLETYYGPRGDKLIAHSHALYKAGDKENSKRAHTLAMRAGDKYIKNPVNRDKAISSIMSGANKDYTSGKRYTGDSVEIEGTPIQEGSAALRLAQALRKEREARELKDKSREAAEKNEKAKQPVQQQENTMDSLAATQAPNDGANTPDDVAPKDKNKKLIQMSKSARIIKSIYKRKNMKEETFDTEKEDKSVATYGKKPKLTDTTKKIDTVGDKTQAAAIMSGGTTLTGTPRDVIEIDPMMKLKPGLMGQSGQSIKPKNNNR